MTGSWPKNFILYLAGNGNNIRFWKDNWHLMRILLNQFPPALRFDYTLHVDAKVEVCIVDGKWAIPPHLVHNIQAIITRLNEVDIDLNTDDEIIWRIGNHGEYSLKDTYNALRLVNCTPWCHNHVLFSRCIPRHSFLTWIALHHAMKTKLKMQGWGKE
ncbi:Reverse transcriptase zinc-binding domain [Macleaya cordata]|uniref:Reverse transcriptase zinc-binding domain n=1 Tax=Macleaya cordata TaxID=56857 RepID=A0A200Q133_MACCD|nr:Reverse transcriptase zinc-binding domain [Macleaya cordata]